MKIAINKTLRRWPVALAAVLMLAGTACTNDPAGLDNNSADNGDRSRVTAEFGVAATGAGLRSRAAAPEQVKSLWVGAFDIETGKIVGQKALDQDEFSGTSGMVKLDLLYYDEHPTVRIFGVANYDDVLASQTSSNDYTKASASLIDLLESGIETVQDFYAIAIDTESAEAAALANGVPLMAGLLTKSADDLFTVRQTAADAFTASNTSANTKVNPAPGAIFERADYTNFNGEYTLYLRRLVSNVTVNVEAGDGVEISDLTWRVVNKPLEVYLQERTTFTTSVSRWADWIYGTPNKADTYLTIASDPEETTVQKVTSALAYTSTEFEAAEGNTFSFSQFENKHWGFDSPNGVRNGKHIEQYSDREIRRQDASLMTDENGNSLPIFMALNPYSGTTSNGNANDYNNFASYFEIKLHVKTGDKVGDVTYLIHEGYCNDAEGKASANNLYDFACFRNTEYTYNVKITGLESISVAVNGGDHSGNPGATGSSWTLQTIEVADGETASAAAGDYAHRAEYDFSQTDFSQLFYRYYYANGDDTPVYYGNWTNDSEEGVTIDELALPEGTLAATEDAEWGIRFFESATDPNGKSFAEFVAAATPGTYWIGFNDPAKITGSPAKFAQSFYLYDASAVKTDSDGCEERTYVHFFRQPIDSRDPLTIENVQLAFTSDSENIADAPVAGHIAGATLSWQLAEEFAAVADKVVYAVYFNGETRPFAENLSDTQLELPENIVNQITAAGTAYTFKIIATDTSDTYADSAKDTASVTPDATGAVKPIPMQFTWNGFTTDLSQGEYFYGENEAYRESDTEKYMGLYLANSMTWSDGYIQTGGTDKLCFTINPPYDGTLTIEAKHTSNSSDNSAYNGLNGRYLLVTDKLGEQRSFASLGTNTTYSFHVKHGEAVQIVTSRSLNIYSISYAYDDPSVLNAGSWNFSDTVWTNILSTVNGNTNFTVEHDGLRIETTGSNAIKFATDGSATNPNYLQYTGQNNLISFVANQSGKVAVIASMTNGTPDSSRKIVVRVGDGEDQVYTLDSGQFAKKSEGSLACNISVTEPTRIYIYTEGGALNICGVDYTK